MIKMKALKSFGTKKGNEGNVFRGREFMAANEARAKELEEHGLAYRIDFKAEPVPLNKMEPPAASNKAAEAGPLDSRGGATGEAAPVPSSPPDHPHRRRRSQRSKDADLL